MRVTNLSSGLATVQYELLPCGTTAHGPRPPRLANYRPVRDHLLLLFWLPVSDTQAACIPASLVLRLRDRQVPRGSLVSTVSAAHWGQQHVTPLVPRIGRAEAWEHRSHSQARLGPRLQTRQAPIRHPLGGCCLLPCTFSNFEADASLCPLRAGFHTSYARHPLVLHPDLFLTSFPCPFIPGPARPQQPPLALCDPSANPPSSRPHARILCTFIHHVRGPTARVWHGRLYR